jgi:hypothetical protein
MSRVSIELDLSFFSYLSFVPPLRGCVVPLLPSSVSRSLSNIADSVKNTLVGRGHDDYDVDSYIPSKRSAKKSMLPSWLGGDDDDSYSRSGRTADFMRKRGGTQTDERRRNDVSPMSVVRNRHIVLGSH